MKGDPIHLCDVVLFDSKAKKEYKIYDVVLAGNDKRKIWSSDLHRDRLIKHAFRTPAKIKKQQSTFSLVIRSIDFKKLIGYSNHDWGLTS